MIETVIRTEAVRIPKLRDTCGAVVPLMNDILEQGLRRPITVWRDGTLISGERRLRAYHIAQKPTIQAVFVNTIEDAAKRMLDDEQDDHLSRPRTWSDICRLWQVLRRLDEPAAVRRLDAARRRGVELRKQVMAGKRPPGRSKSVEDYALAVICEPFGISSATAHRIEVVYKAACVTENIPDDHRALARECMRDIDAGMPVWPAYQRFMGVRSAPVVRPRPVAAPEPAPATRQLTAWEKSLPQLEGLVAGLIELGPPNADLTWDQVGPVHARLKAARRDLEKIINKMRETNRS